MTHVWSHSKQKGAALLLLLAISDFANDDGEAWPAVETLASKIRMSERYTHMLIAKLVESGEIAVDPNGGKHGCNLFMVGGVKPSAPQGVKPASGGGEARFPKGVKPASPEPSLTVIEPSVNHMLEIQTVYENLLGRKLERSEWSRGESAAAKSIAGQYTPEQLAQAYRHYKAQPFWADKRLSLGYLSKNMHDLLTGGQHQNTSAFRLPEGV